MERPQGSLNARRWKCSEYGTYPGHDKVLEDDPKRAKLLVLDARACSKCQLMTVRDRFYAALNVKGMPDT